MALYHFHCDILKRTEGKSAVASIAYELRARIKDEEQNRTYNYTKNKSKCLDDFFLSADEEEHHCTEKHAQFWNEVQKVENRKNSQFCRDFDIALQKELTLEENEKCLKKLLKVFTDKKLSASVCIHEGDKNNDNIHAHVMVSLRPKDENGWAKNKDRDCNSKEFLEQLRKNWADIVNEEFKLHWIDAKIDHRTLAEQGIEREPQQHQGAIATAIERKGKIADRTKYENLEQETETLEELEKQLSELLIERNMTEKEQKSYEYWCEKFAKMSHQQFQNFCQTELKERQNKISLYAAAHVLQRDRSEFLDELDKGNDNYLERFEVSQEIKTNLKISIPDLMNEGKGYVTVIAHDGNTEKSALKIMQKTSDKPSFLNFCNKLREKMRDLIDHSPLGAGFRGLKKAVDFFRDRFRLQNRPTIEPKKQIDNDYDFDR